MVLSGPLYDPLCVGHPVGLDRLYKEENKLGHHFCLRFQGVNISLILALVGHHDPLFSYTNSIIMSDYLAPVLIQNNFI